MKARRRAAALLAASTCVAALPSAFAATTPASPAAVPASPMASMLQGLVGLVIVVGLIYIAAWLLKKVGPRARSGGMVQVVGGASVGPREKVVVVRFAGETLLLGVASGNVTLLHTADALAAADGAIVEARAETAPRFVDRLRAAARGQR